jgi:hypothetical protein
VVTTGFLLGDFLFSEPYHAVAIFLLAVLQLASHLLLRTGLKDFISKGEGGGVGWLKSHLEGSWAGEFSEHLSFFPLPGECRVFTLLPIVPFGSIHHHFLCGPYMDLISKKFDL